MATTINNTLSLTFDVVNREIKNEFLKSNEYNQKQKSGSYRIAVFLFTFLGMGAGPFQLGKKAREILELGKIAREIILKFS